MSCGNPRSARRNGPTRDQRGCYTAAGFAVVDWLCQSSNRVSPRIGTAGGRIEVSRDGRPCDGRRGADCGSGPSGHERRGACPGRLRLGARLTPELSNPNWSQKNDRHVPPRRASAFPHRWRDLGRNCSRTSRKSSPTPESNRSSQHGLPTGVRRSRTTRIDRQRPGWTLIWTLIDPVSCVSCFSWWYCVNSAETHETFRWESGMRYQHTTTSGG